MNPRWPYSADKGKLKKGPWTFEEDLRLLRYIRLHGEGRWSALAKAAGLQRCGKSCRLRWVNYLRPDLKRGNITPEEEQVIIDLHARWGNRWSLIAERMPGRTDNEIKNYWRCHLKKKLQRDNISTVEYNANDESPFPSPLVEQQLTTSGNTSLDVLYEEKHCSASASASASASLLLYEEKHCSASASASASASLVLYEEKHCSASASASLVYEDKPLLVSSSTADEEIHRKGNSDLEDYNYMAQRGGGGGGVNGYEGIELGGINESVLDAPPSILYRFPSGIPIEDDAAARVLQVPNSRVNSNADYNIGCEVEYWGLDVGADIMLWNLCSTPNSISQCESHSPFSYAHHM